MKVCVWYIVGSHPGEMEHLKLSLQVMEEHEWVDSIYILHTYTEGPTMRLISDSARIYEEHVPFGDGMSKPISEGGFNEVEARNHAIERATELCKPDWLLQCDCDEFYTDDFGAEIAKADAEGKELIWVDCSHFIAPNQRKINKTIYDPNGRDPHMRGWKANTGMRFEYNKNTKFMEQYANKSLHCTLPGNNGLNPYFAEGIFHIHVHDMIGYKKRGLGPNAELVDVDRDFMPECYMEAWEAENAK